jgi:hypothetical protein
MSTQCDSNVMYIYDPRRSSLSEGRVELETCCYVEL